VKFEKKIRLSPFAVNPQNSPSRTTDLLATYLCCGSAIYWWFDFDA